MPRTYRIAQDTRLLEYDDSFCIEGKCPKCGTIHSGAWDKCNNCLEREYQEECRLTEEYEEWERGQYNNAEEDWQEDKKNVFEGTPDWLRMEE